MCDDETELTEEEIAAMWDQAKPTELKPRKLIFSPQAAAAMGKLGSNRLMELDTRPNPLECPVCHTVGKWRRDDKNRDKILCVNDGTHIMTFVEDDDPPIEDAFRVEFPQR